MSICDDCKYKKFNKKKRAYYCKYGYTLGKKECPKHKDDVPRMNFIQYRKVLKEVIESFTASASILQIKKGFYYCFSEWVEQRFDNEKIGFEKSMATLKEILENIDHFIEWKEGEEYAIRKKGKRKNNN
jgi:hypothetical protein